MAMIRTSRHFSHPDSGMTHGVPSEITPRAVYEGRRAWLKQAALGGAAVGLNAASGLWLSGEAEAATAAAPLVARPGVLAPLPGARSTVAGAYAMDKVTPYEKITRYNNFYEFGTDKTDPPVMAKALKTPELAKDRFAVAGHTDATGAIVIPVESVMAFLVAANDTARAAFKAAAWSIRQ